jgi:hypothetical protein
MRAMKFVLSLVFVCAVWARLGADQPLHVVTLKNCAEFELVSAPAKISVYPISDAMKRVTTTGSRPTLAAASYDVGVTVKTANPSQALQALVQQVAEQTGRKLAKFFDTRLSAMKPVTMLMAVDGNSVWCFVLTPKAEQPDTYLLSCGYVIDAEPAVPPGPAPK